MAEAPTVTLLQDAPASASDGAPSKRAPGRSLSPISRISREHAGDVAVGIAALWWALPLTHAVGGRDAGKEAVLCLLLLIAAAVTAPWRRLPLAAVVIPCWLTLAALVIPAVAPTGWRGADDATGYACAAMAFLVAAGWATTPTRRAALVGVIGLAGLDQLVHALLPWWGGGDPSVELTGTFYWHNPFAAYLLPPAVMGMALVTWRVRPWHLVGWIVAPLAFAGIVLSTSRATLAVAVLAIAVIGLLALRDSERRVRVTRLVSVAVLTVAVTEILPGPPLFAHRVSPLASTATRSSGGETLAANGGYRLEFWRSAIQNFVHHPLIGTGYHGLIESSRAYTPGGWARSNYAHNGYLQALSDGGLLLALPLVLGCAILTWMSVRSLGRAIRHGIVEPLPVAAGGVLLAALAHSGVDFDWSHSSLFVMDALVGALVVAARVVPGEAGSEQRENHQSRNRIIAGAVLSLTALAVGVGALGHRDADASQSGGTLTQEASRFAAAAKRPLASDAAAISLLGLAVDHPNQVSRADQELAVAGTTREAGIDLDLAADRARVLINLGSRADATTVIRRLEQVLPGRDPYAASLAPLLTADGQPAAARAILRPLLVSSFADHGAGAVPFAQAWAASEPGDPTGVCLVAAATTPTAVPTSTCAELIHAALAP